MPMQCMAPTPPTPRATRSPTSSPTSRSARAESATTVIEHTLIASTAPATGQAAGADATPALPNLFGLDRAGLRALFEELGEKPWRADQVMKWMYHRHVTDFEAMTDLGKALRAKLQAAVCIQPPQVLFEKQSADGTHKWLIGMDGGNAIETVFIP